MTSRSALLRVAGSDSHLAVIGSQIGGQFPTLPYRRSLLLNEHRHVFRSDEIVALPFSLLVPIG